MGHADFVEHLYEVHVGGAVEILVVLYRLPSELVLEMEEEGCRNVSIRAALVEYLEDALTAVVSNLLLGSYCLETCGCKQSHSDGFENNLFHKFFIIISMFRYSNSGP